MKKTLVALALLWFSQYAVYAQNAYQVLKSASKVKVSAKSAAVINRHMCAPASCARLASQVASLSRPFQRSHYYQNHIVQKKMGTVVIPQIHIITTFSAPVLKDPSSLWGSYHYMRALTKLSRTQGAVHPQYASKWKDVFTTTRYNGVHHIVNKSTLKAIYDEMKRQAASKGRVFTVNLEDMQREAPGSLHPFHGNPKHAVVFHNLDNQMRLYRRGGIKAIVLDYFAQLQRFRLLYPDAPFIPQEVVTNTLLEAQLWSETFQLKWE